MLRHGAVFAAIALSGAALDLWTKHLAFAHNPWGLDIPVVDGFFSFGKTRNPGVVFGLGPGMRVFWKVVAVAAVPLLVGLFLFTRRPRWILTVTLGMILAGTLGNMVDRLGPEGSVRDFLKFYVVVDGVPRVWPLFNLADAYICVGVFLLTLEMVFFDERRAAAAPSPPAPSAPTAAP
ncbi:MAG TPA: signal peptidase II [Planctomycetota bacterium]|nr:signal peptidase II [Planctomycetota bacterium]